jgi:hypothetical protein
MRARVLVAAGLLAVLLGASGSGGSAAESAAPAYATIGGNDGSQTLVRVDPATLKPLAGELAIPNGLAFGGRSPDGRSAVYFAFRQPSVQVVDLEALQLRRRIQVAPAGWRARAAAWLTADRVAVVMQRMRGSYEQIVERRQVVLVDPFAGRVVSRRDVPHALAVLTSAAAGDKLVLLLGRGDARGRAFRVVVGDATGDAREATVDLGPAKGLRLPALAVEPDGSRAFVLSANGRAAEVDLQSMTVTARTIVGGGRIVTDSLLAGREAVVLADGNVAFTGHNGHREKGVEVSRPAGLGIVDTKTWRLRVIDREASRVSVSGETLLATSHRIDRAVDRGRPIQKVSGIGVRAYAIDGTRRWHRYGNQPLTATAFRQVALVHRHASPPVGWGGSFVIELEQGRQVRANTGARQNVWLLPDVPTARPVRALASAGESEALEPEGEDGSFQARVRPDVTRVVATLVDGSERELAIEDGAVRYAAATPEESAQAVQAFAGDRLLTSISLPVVCGGSAGPCAQEVQAPPAAQEERSFAILRSRAGTRLAEVDPRTLAPIAGRAAAIDARTSAHALSADGSGAAVGSYESATVRVFSTTNLERPVHFALAPGNAGVRALEWLAPNRLVAIVQSYKRADRRAVSGRELVVLDPANGKIVRRTKLPIGRAIVDVQASGGRLVAALRSSNHRGTGITLLVGDAAGRVRSREIQLRQTEGVLPETRLTLERGGERAFLLGRQPGGGGPQPLRVIDLDGLTVTQHRVTIAAGRYQPPSAFTGRAESFGDHGILISGAFVPLFRDGEHVPPAGTFLLDTRTFRIRQLDARANAFVVAGDRAYTFGSTAQRAPAAPRGIGVSAYDTNGRRLYHAFGTRTFTQFVAAAGYGHLLRSDRSQAVAFELESGRSLGSRPVPRQEVEILESADDTRTMRTPPQPVAATRRPAAAAASRGYTVSNRGRQVEPKQARGRLFPDHPYKLFLLGTQDGKAFYRVQVTPRFSCWGSGKASRIGDVGTLGCPNVVGAYPLQSDNRESRGGSAGEIRYVRIDGIAADQAATVALIGEQNQRLATVPVRANLYSFPPPYPGGFLRVVALDQAGKELKPHPEWGERQTPPPHLFGPRATRVERPRLTAPVQRASARGVEAKAGRNSVVVLDGTAIEPRARKLLSGRTIGVSCFVLSANHRQTRSAGLSASWKPRIAFKLLGIKAPLDGCQLQGSYGHRWRDQYGTHSAVEIAFTAKARRYFKNRAAARDLALFVRSRKTQQLRKKSGAELIAALRATYGDQVRIVGSERAVLPAGVLGVWTRGNRTVFSERSTVGVRFFVEVINGKITKQNVRGLAFVF